MCTTTYSILMWISFRWLYFFLHFFMGCKWFHFIHPRKYPPDGQRSESVSSSAMFASRKNTWDEWKCRPPHNEHTFKNEYVWLIEWFTCYHVWPEVTNVIPKNWIHMFSNGYTYDIGNETIFGYPRFRQKILFSKTDSYSPNGFLSTFNPIKTIFCCAAECNLWKEIHTWTPKRCI